MAESGKFGDGENGLTVHNLDSQSPNQMEFASKSQGSPHYMPTEQTSHFPNVGFRGQSNHTVGSHNSSYHGDNSVLPHKTSESTPTSVENMVKLDHGNVNEYPSQNHIDSGRASFFSKKD